MAVACLQPKEYVRAGSRGSDRYSETEAMEYTRWLATHHYENFQVVSFLLPRHLHQDFYNVYSFCRWADDLGDEIGDPPRACACSPGGGANCRPCIGVTRPIRSSLRCSDTVRNVRSPASLLTA